MENDIYTIGRCGICWKEGQALKNGICAECGNKPLKCGNKDGNMPDFFDDLLKGFPGNDTIKK